MCICIYACSFISFNFGRENLAEKINAPGRDEHNFFSLSNFYYYYFLLKFALISDIS